MIAHCLFEQSGTFKNEFKKLGIEAYDYDILNDYGQTDFKIDLYKEIRGGYNKEVSIFDNIKQEDIIMAFFPCTRFESRIQLAYRGESYQLLNYSDRDKLEISMQLHRELHENYDVISKMVCIALDKNLKMIIENPYTQPHYLTQFWCIKPKIVDKNRRENGDYMEKPTQYFCINFEPKQNVIFEPIEFVEKRKVDYIQGKDRARIRSEIHPQYANRFIRQFILDDTEENKLKNKDIIFDFTDSKWTKKE